MEHPKTLSELSVAEAARAAASLDYVALADFLTKLSHCLERDAKLDRASGHVRLADKLYQTAVFVAHAAECMEAASHVLPQQMNADEVSRESAYLESRRSDSIERYYEQKLKLQNRCTHRKADGSPAETSFDSVEVRTFCAACGKEL